MGAEPLRRAQQSSRASIGQGQMVAGGGVRVVQIAGELPEQLAPVLVEGLRFAGDLDHVLPVAAKAMSPTGANFCTSRAGSSRLCWTIPANPSA